MNHDVLAHHGVDYNAALNHYKGWGIPEGRTPNPFFFPHYYNGLYPDIQAHFRGNMREVLFHWKNHGIREGRRGSPIFDPRFYFAHYADLSRAYGTDYTRAYEHYVKHGIPEGRIGVAEVAEPLVNANYTLNQSAMAKLPGALGVISAGITIVDFAVKAYNAIDRWQNDRIREHRDRTTVEIDREHGVRLPASREHDGWQA